MFICFCTNKFQETLLFEFQQLTISLVWGFWLFYVHNVTSQLVNTVFFLDIKFHCTSCNHLLIIVLYSAIIIYLEYKIFFLNYQNKWCIFEQNKNVDELKSFKFNWLIYLDFSQHFVFKTLYSIMNGSNVMLKYY